MAGDQLKRFEQWRQRLPENATYLTSLIIDEIVPIFREQGFDRFADYAGGSAYAVGPNCVSLQRRSGSEWPTVEIVFDKRCRPALGINFTMLPEVCWRETGHGTQKILRIEANVAEGPAFFILCKGKRTNFDCDFGYRWLALRPKSKLDGEVAILKSLLPWLFNVLEMGIPDAWYRKSPGYVSQYAFLSRASRIFRNT